MIILPCVLCVKHLSFRWKNDPTVGTPEKDCLCLDQGELNRYIIFFSLFFYTRTSNSTGTGMELKQHRRELKRKNALSLSFLHAPIVTDSICTESKKKTPLLVFFTCFYLFFFIGLVAGCHSFCLFSVFITYSTDIHSITFTLSTYPSPFAGASLHHTGTRTCR